MKVKSESEVAQSCPTLHDPMDCSLPGSSVHGIFQARALEWSAIAFSLLLSGGHKTNKPMKNKIKPNFDKPHSAEKFQLSKSSISYLNKEYKSLCVKWVSGGVCMPLVLVFK